MQKPNKSDNIATIKSYLRLNGIEFKESWNKQQLLNLLEDENEVPRETVEEVPREKLIEQDEIWKKICRDLGWEFRRTIL